MYPAIKTPAFANKNTHSFSKEEAKDYFKWFMSIKNDRLQILEKAIQETYPEWKLDYTRNSLIKLYEWFQKKVMYRNMGEDEKEEIKKQISTTPLFIGVIEIPEKTFTIETISICFDAGAYFGDTLIFNIPGTKWVQKINSIRFIDYAQPLIETKVSKIPINPRGAMEGIARRIIDRDIKEVSFIEFFDKLVLRFSNELQQ